MKLATGADEAFADPIKALANSKIADIKQLVIDGKWQNTIATNPYYIQETTGKDFDNFAYAKDDKGNIQTKDGEPVFSSAFNSYYNKAYGGLDESPEEKQQHKKEIYDQEKEAIAKQITDKEDNIVTGTNEAVKNQIAAKKLSDEEQKTTPTIKPASTTLIIGGNTMQVAKNYDIGSSSTKNKNMVSLNTIGSNVKDNTPSNLSGNYYVDNVFISDDGSAKAIVSDTPYNALDESGNALHQDQQGNWLNAKNEETEPTKFIKDPNANESVVNYNDVSSTINTNFNLQDFPAINTSVKQQTAQPNNTTPQSKQGSFFNK
jgi:23S rRNA pseudoU1915 N3-methylase RlmH